MRPNEDIAKKPHDISEVISAALEYNPNLGMADLSTVRMWLNEGCDIELDIMPVFQKITKYKKGISRFSYFTNPILDSKEKRLIELNKPKTPEVSLQKRLDIYNWKIRMNLTLTEEEEKFIKENQAI